MANLVIRPIVRGPSVSPPSDIIKQVIKPLPQQVKVKPVFNTLPISTPGINIITNTPVSKPSIFTGNDSPPSAVIQTVINSMPKQSGPDGTYKSVQTLGGVFQSGGTGGGGSGSSATPSKDDIIPTLKNPLFEMVILSIVLYAIYSLVAK